MNLKKDAIEKDGKCVSLTVILTFRHHSMAFLCFVAINLMFKYKINQMRLNTNHYCL